MEKRYALLLAFLVTGLIASNTYLLSPPEKQAERETAAISKVLDGDTVDLEDGRRVRLLNINAPEKSQPLSELGIDFLKMYENKTIEIEVTGIEKYGRTLARIYSDSYINLDLVKRGFAHRYIVEDKEMSSYKNAESFAIKNELGIWKHSEYYGCLSVEVKKEDEFLIIENNCDRDFKNLALKDESTKTSRFDILKSQKLVIYSGKGQDSENEVYLDSTRNIWNDDKDSIFIRDEEGLLIHYDSYGY